MKKALTVLMCFVMMICCVSCSENNLTESLTNIKDGVITPTLPENFYLDYLYYEDDGTSTDIIMARVDGDFFYWTDADTTMHYFRQNGDKWDEYTKNAAETTDYTAEPVKSYQNLDDVMNDKYQLITRTGDFLKNDKSPKQEIYYGLNCLKYEVGEDYMYLSTDYNFVVECSIKIDENSAQVYGVYMGEQSLIIGYNAFTDDAMVPAQFHDEVAISE